MLRTIFVALCILFGFWFFQTLSGEIQEVRECEARGGTWIKERCIERRDR